MKPIPPHLRRPVETDEHEIWRDDDRTTAAKGMTAGLIFSLPFWVLAVWAVGVI